MERLLKLLVLAVWMPALKQTDVVELEISCVDCQEEKWLFSIYI